MKELNKNTLDQAIRDLPQYQPPAQLWEDIAEVLDEIEEDKALRYSIGQLPVYDPPEKVWQTIEGALSSEPPVRRRRAIRPIYWLSAAASLALLIATVWWWSRGSDARVELSYYEEVFDPALTLQSWEEDEEAFQLIKQWCASGPIACKQNEFRDLEAELDLLTAARNELKEALGSYSTDKQLIAQLTRIELQRSDVLKKLMKQI